MFNTCCCLYWLDESTIGVQYLQLLLFNIMLIEYSTFQCFASIRAKNHGIRNMKQMGK